jgi:hypothetical protein
MEDANFGLHLRDAESQCAHRLLKVDIEGDEWNWLQQVLKTKMLDKVKQLGLEVHFDPDMEKFREQSKTLKNLETYGMIRFSPRVNIWMKAPH